MKHLSKIFTLLFFAVSLYAASGKIAGVITDASTGEALPGVNVYLEGTTIGAATDLEGYYAILNVPPGTYTMKVVSIGYAEKTYKEVRVFINQTTTINVEMVEESFEIEEAITVVAERPVVEKDVATSRANISSAEIEVLPIATVTEAVGLQAGIQGLSIRAGGSDETAFIVDGFTLRDERDNTPYTGISLTSVSEVQVQSGGFSARYGNLRSGVINVVTKEGSTSKYDVNVIYRFSPAANKHFGQSFNSPNAYWVRPYLDDDVAWTGTKNGAWDRWTQAQYPEFDGWNAISQDLLADDNPDNDLTPEAAQRLFLFQHRKVTDIDIPDYDLDMSFGGPVPFAKDLGNLRFFTSFRQQQEAYLLPLARDAYRNYNWQFKLTSDVAPGEKLIFSALIGKQTGTSRSRSGAPSLFTSTGAIASDLTNVSYTNARIFSTDYWNPSERDYNSFGAKYTSLLSNKSYLDVSFDIFRSKYFTALGGFRDTSRVYSFGSSYFVDEAPFGFWPDPSFAIENDMRMSVGFSNARDTSESIVFTLKADYNNQLSRFHNFSTGFEFAITDSRINYGSYDAFLQDSNFNVRWDRTPVRGAFYVEDKMEFEGMIANLGLRMDYFNAGGEWYKDYDPYDPAFKGENSNGIDTLLEKESTKDIITVSPRLGISFPITENSKIAFNYGHYYQVPNPENLFLLLRDGQTNAITRIADPNAPFPKTIAYELIYEHNLFDQYLLRMAGYYKDLSDQPRLVTYEGFNSETVIRRNEPDSYEDIRGFEITLDKKRGRYFRGFINYTYLVRTSGTFGQSIFPANPVEQREQEARASNANQFRPLPQPYARANLTFTTPEDYGPKWLDVNFLENFTLNILGNWSAGSYFTWLNLASSVDLGVQYNVQWKDYYNINIKLSRRFNVGPANIELFMDIYNVFNFKRFSTYGFLNAGATNDYTSYMQSLHLPSDTDGFQYDLGYVNIPGDDQPGDYRKNGVDFTPIVAVRDVSAISQPNVNDLYYEASSKRYLRYTDSGEWINESKSRVDKILDDKAYIDMPNQKYLTFLNPRDIFFGIKLGFDF